MPKPIRKPQSGFALLSTVISVAVLGFTIIFILKAQSVTSNNINLAKATVDVEKMREYIRGFLDCDTTAIHSGNYCDNNDYISLYSKSDAVVIKRPQNELENGTTTISYTTVEGQSRNYNLRAKCDKGDIHVENAVESTEKWAFLFDKIPLYCKIGPGPLPSPPPMPFTICSQKQTDPYYDIEDLPVGYTPEDYHFELGSLAQSARVFQFSSDDATYNARWPDRAMTRRVVRYFDGMKNTSWAPHTPVELGVCFPWQNHRLDNSDPLVNRVTTTHFHFNGEIAFPEVWDPFEVYVQPKFIAKMRNANLVIEPIFYPPLAGIICNNEPFSLHIGDVEQTIDYSKGFQLPIACNRATLDMEIWVKVRVILDDGLPSYFEPLSELAIDITKVPSAAPSPSPSPTPSPSPSPVSIVCGVPVTTPHSDSSCSTGAAFLLPTYTQNDYNISPLAYWSFYTTGYFPNLCSFELSRMDLRFNPLGTPSETCISANIKPGIYNTSAALYGTRWVKVLSTTSQQVLYQKFKARMRNFKLELITSMSAYPSGPKSYKWSHATTYSTGDVEQVIDIDETIPMKDYTKLSPQNPNDGLLYLSVTYKLTRTGTNTDSFVEPLSNFESRIGRQ